MPTMCIQCAMRAMVEGKEPPVFDEEPAEHAARVHPDPIETLRERRELEAKLAKMIPRDNGSQ